MNCFRFLEMGCHTYTSRFCTEQGGPGWEEVRSRRPNPAFALPVGQPIWRRGNIS